MKFNKIYFATTTAIWTALTVIILLSDMPLDHQVMSVFAALLFVYDSYQASFKRKAAPRRCLLTRIKR